MSSHHDHDHGHDHHHHKHDHDHHHEHNDHHEDEGSSQGPSFDEKLIKLFEHWIRHNEDHARNYMDWGIKAKSQGLDGIATLLDEIARLSDQLTEKLKAGLNKAKKS